MVTSRVFTIVLSEGERRAALEAISQQTEGNARDFDEWRRSTCGTWNQWRALLRAENKIDKARGSRS